MVAVPQAVEEEGRDVRTGVLRLGMGTETRYLIGLGAKL